MLTVNLAYLPHSGLGHTIYNSVRLFEVITPAILLLLFTEIYSFSGLEGIGLELFCWLPMSKAPSSFAKVVFNKPVLSVRTRFGSSDLMSCCTVFISSSCVGPDAFELELFLSPFKVMSFSTVSSSSASSSCFST